MLFTALQHGQTPYEQKLNLYSLSTYVLANKGGQIGKDRQRIHSWLESNGFPLVQMVEPGSNLSGRLSQVKLTQWVTLDDSLAINTQAMTDDQISREIDAYLAGDADSDEELFTYLYPEIQVGVEESLLRSLFDFVKVDTRSLEAYVEWLRGKSTKLGKDKLTTIERQAKIILAVARFTGGWLVQRRKASEFGRTYYTGISAQSVHKELRKAMLGKCCEYDVRSSVIAWKMGYAQDCVNENCAGSSVRDEFKTTLLFLEDKKDLMNTVRLYTFLEDSNVDREYQIHLLKQAFTALCFGARLTAKGWKSSNGAWENPALVEILKNPAERKRFVNDPAVLAFIKEQNKLDDYLMEWVKLNMPELLKEPVVQTASGRPSKAKVVAYLYQHGETELMDLVRDAVKASDRKVLASIHDAIIINKRLSAESKVEIELMLHEKTGNPYWRLGVTEYEPYHSISKQVLRVEMEHELRTKQQEELAKVWAVQRRLH